MCVCVCVFACGCAINREALCPALVPHHFLQVAAVLAHKMSGCETMVSVVDRGVTKLTSECRVRLMRTLHTHLKIAYSHGHTSVILGTFGCERDSKLPSRHVSVPHGACCAYGVCCAYGHGLPFPHPTSPTSCCIVDRSIFSGPLFFGILMQSDHRS